MRDWQELVRQRLAGLKLHPAEREEVHAELAAHLEESYEALLKEGVTEAAAAQQALTLTGDWKELRRRIQMARTKGNNMTNRVRQFWLPGFLTLFSSMMLLMIIEFFGPRPKIIQLHGWSMIAPVMVVYVPWLLALLLIGALGAYLSHRAGASQRVVLLSILFPVLPHLCFCVIGFPMALILGDHFAHSILASAILVGFLAWVLLPGTALLAGGLPAQLFLSRRPASRGVMAG